MLGWFKKKLGKDYGFSDDQSDAPRDESMLSGGQQDEYAQAPDKSVEKPDLVYEDDTDFSLVDDEEKTLSAQDSESIEGMQGFFQRMRQQLSRTRDSFVNQMDELFLGRKEIDSLLFDELEDLLIGADLGAATSFELLEQARAQVKRDSLSDPLELKKILRDLILDSLNKSDKPAELVMPEKGPFVIMVLGVNGVGKTTTIGKLAWKFKQSGQKVLLVAADTFRAAAIEQLQAWSERVGVDIVAQKQGADPSSVIYDAFDYARTRDFDVIIIDTAGRLHTKVNLMEELRKIKRVMSRKLETAPHEVMLVIDATTGQNGISQARQFKEAVEVSGIALTKLDGTARGGIVVNISREFNIPIRFIGIGEQMQDLRDFSPQEFVAALFDQARQDGSSNKAIAAYENKG